MKKEISIVFIGHKDHGKSSLIGRLLLDTKSAKKSSIQSIKKIDKTACRHFEIAHIVDSFKEERENEMTIDTATAVIRRNNAVYHLVDVPGHRGLISNMLTGASAASTAVLVVALDEGIKSQTKQHLFLARVLGIDQIAVAINKIDKVKYRKEKIDDLTLKLKNILSNLGFDNKKVYFFPVSAKKGDNIVLKSKKTPWYKGKTLFNFIENIRNKRVVRADKNMVFLVQDKYSTQNIVVGRIERGTIRAGQKILILPEGEFNTIKKIRLGERSVKRCTQGETIGIIFKNIFLSGRNSVVCNPKSQLKAESKFMAALFWIKKPTKKILTCNCGNSISTVKKISPNKGNENIYKITLTKPIVVDRINNGILNKIIFKNDGEIIGLGRIL